GTRAARDAGHEVAFATGPDMCRHLAAHGLDAWAVGPTHAEIAAAAPPSARWFALCAPARAAALVPRVAAWRPDLVVADEFDLAGPVAARVAGAPYVVHGLGVMPPMPIWEGLLPAIDALHAGHGLAGGVDDVRGATYLEAVPPGLRPPGERMWRRMRPMRPAPGLAAKGERLPPALEALPHARTVHLTLGTLFNRTPGVLATALAGLRTLPANVVATCGPDVDPASLGPQPPNVLVARYLPHDLLVPRCDLVVSQGGAGIMLGALLNGVPHLMLPQGADQFIDADVCTRAGAALALAPDAFGADAVREAAARLLGEPAFAAAAARLGAAIREMPAAAQVLADLAGVGALS
ncbi:MAG TPA: glycosyltransferase, partial [Miltoncostaea sp.]|nr:glycosyltransferase [Miltoncostaea sp.]